MGGISNKILRYLMYVGDRLHQWAWDRFYKRRKVIRHVGGRTGKIYTFKRK